MRTMDDDGYDGCTGLVQFLPSDVVLPALLPEATAGRNNNPV